MRGWEDEVEWGGLNRKRQGGAFGNNGNVLYPDLKFVGGYVGLSICKVHQAAY